MFYRFFDHNNPNHPFINQTGCVKVSLAFLEGLMVGYFGGYHILKLYPCDNMVKGVLLMAPTLLTIGMADSYRVAYRYGAYSALSFYLTSMAVGLWWGINSVGETLEQQSLYKLGGY